MESVIQTIKAAGLKINILDEETKLCALKNFLSDCNSSREKKDYRRVSYSFELDNITLVYGDVL